MSWLFGQAWLWYLAAFAVGVAAAWLVLVRPRQRLLRALEIAVERDRAEREHAAAVAAPVRVEEPPPVDDVVAERVRATDSALSTLDMFAAGPLRTTRYPGPGGAAAAGLGAAGPGAATPGDPTPDDPTPGNAARTGSPRPDA